MRNLIIISLVFITSILSCTKVGRNITVKGKVLNPLTGTTYEDIKVQLVRIKNLQLPGGFTEIKHTHTDANGEFELNATRLGDVWVQAQSGSDLYVLGWHQDGEYISSNFRTTAQKRKTMEVEYHLVPYGEYQIIVNNINCGGVNDTIIINRQNYTQTFLGNDWIITGCDGAFTSWTKMPMGNIYTHWTVIRNGVSQSFSDTVFLDEGQQLTYELNY